MQQFAHDLNFGVETPIFSTLRACAVMFCCPKPVADVHLPCCAGTVNCGNQKGVCIWTGSLGFLSHSTRTCLVTKATLCSSNVALAAEACQL